MSGRRLFFILTGCGTVVLLLAIGLFGYQAVFHFIGVKAMSPVFLDLHTITAGAESHVLGFDPLHENPRDPFLRPLNYPRLWQLLFLLPINQGHTLVLGCGLILIFLLSLPLFTGIINRTTAVLLFSALFSPAVLLGVERANVDLLIFALMAGAVYFSRRLPLVTAAFLQVGILLKLYPLAGLGVLLGSGRKKFLLLSLLVCGVSLLYFYFTLDDLVRIQQTTQKGIRLAYGVNVLPMAVARFKPTWEPLLTLGSYMLLLLCVLSALLTKPADRWIPADKQGMELDGFRLGSGIYLGTFLLGNNFNYRLIFLLFTIPQLVHWAGSNSPALSRRATAALVVIMFSLWSQFLAIFPDQNPIAGLLFLADETANWLAFALLLQLVLGSLPEWALNWTTKLRSTGRQSTESLP